MLSSIEIIKINSSFKHIAIRLMITSTWILVCYVLLYTHFANANAANTDNNETANSGQQQQERLCGDVDTGIYKCNSNNNRDDQQQQQQQSCSKADNSQCRPPIADAGKNTAVDEGKSVDLNGRNSRGHIDSYSWTYNHRNEGSFSINPDDLGKAKFTAPEVSSDTTYVFKLTVKDTNGLSDTDTVKVKVRDVSSSPPHPPPPIHSVDHKPIADAGNGAKIKRGNINIVLDGSQSRDPDPEDENNLTYQWEQISNGFPVPIRDANKAQATFDVPSAYEDKVLKFRLTVYDPHQENDSSTVDFILTKTNTNGGESGNNSGEGTDGAIIGGNIINTGAIEKIFSQDNKLSTEKPFLTIGSIAAIAAIAAIALIIGVIIYKLHNRAHKSSLSVEVEMKGGIGE